MSTPSVRDALEKLAKVFAGQPHKARSKNPAATAVFENGLKFQVTGPSSLASCNATVIAMRAAQVGVTLTSLEVSVSSESDTRGLLGTDDSVSAGLFDLRTHVKIGAKDATADQLQEIVQWADAHSPVGCTIRRSPTNAVEIEVL